MVISDADSEKRSGKFLPFNDVASIEKYLLLVVALCPLRLSRQRTPMDCSFFITARLAIESRGMEGVQRLCTVRDDTRMWMTPQLLMMTSKDFKLRPRQVDWKVVALSTAYSMDREVDVRTLSVQGLEQLRQSFENVRKSARM